MFSSAAKAESRLARAASPAGAVGPFDFGSCADATAWICFKVIQMPFSEWILSGEILVDVQDTLGVAVVDG